MDNKYDMEKEINYRKYFSPIKYRIFLFLEKNYKKFINSSDERISIIISFLVKEKPIRILEIGSGTLPIYKFIPDSIKGQIEYHICEINPQKVLFINKNYPDIITSCSDALHLIYLDRQFDLVFSKGVLHHIDDADFGIMTTKRNKFIKEMLRVTKINGSILLMDFSYNKSFSSILWHFLHKIFFSEGEHNFYTLDKCLELFRDKSLIDIVGKKFNTFKGVYYYITAKKYEH